MDRIDFTDYRRQINSLSNYSTIQTIVRNLLASVRATPVSNSFVYHNSWYVESVGASGERFFCKSCKIEIKFGDKFCRGCGKQQLWALFG